ncbi:MAG: hypothetical protein ABEH38_06305 [Flavobacteriales bacterium]
MQRSIPLRALIFLCLSTGLFTKGEFAQGLYAQHGLVPNGGFEDSTEVEWQLSYGKAFFEDSISLNGVKSLGIEEEEGHIDLVYKELHVKDGGTYELSFWYRGWEGHREGAPFWVELVRDGRSLKLFRPGAEKARMRKLHLDWIFFSKKVRIEASGSIKLHIHSDLSNLWLDDVSLQRKG